MDNISGGASSSEEDALDIAARRSEQKIIEAQKLGDLSHEYAKKVYDLSENCLMAHSIRAVQRFLESRSKGRHWITVTLATPKKYLGKRAIAFIQPDHTEIIVDANCGFEHQRRGIAHELAHLLFVKLNGHSASAPTRRIDPLTEESCVIFEKDLCKRHHNFYLNPENRNKLLFQSLVDHSVPA